MGYQIAIDGPAGAGKSTIAKLVAEQMDFVYVDTGALYRGLAVHFLKEGVAEGDEAALTKSCREARIDLGYDRGVQQVFLNGDNITSLLREENVGNLASKISALRVVREKLLQTQREIAEKNDVIMDGRDIGTCVLPEADVKIFLTASVETRAKRRYDQLIAEGKEADLARIEADIQERDYRDSHREIAPLKQAEDAVLLDTSQWTIRQVVEKIQEIIGQKEKKSGN